ncbi:hypothetical protein [Polyangium aurulentum]|uniref:hypothetical protein n=1 Tax=Polyangium aurulentum TaxID=2567896 RepID=UPI0010AEE6CE|nr:hypothetical protein [Polyangium aurulentum]UQA59197.1 hypothetical protein E8A73_001375 [Polyangium aurulentum]
MRPKPRTALILAPALLTTGCGAGETPPTLRPITPPPAASEPAPPFTSPARWSFHPPTPANALATLTLPDGSCVLTTDDGARWRARAPKPGETGCSGKAEPASDLAPEALVGVVKKSDAAWLFVGASGTLYNAEGPLAPLGRSIPAPERFTHVAGGGGTVLATTVTGALFRHEEASGWQPVPQLAGRIDDVAVADDGRAFALALPERIFASEDGKRWRPVDVGTVGARRLGRAPSGALVAQGISTSIVWEAGKNPPVQRPEPVTSMAGEVALETQFVPTATSVSEGRAVLDGDRYFELVLPDEEGDYSLATGRLDGPLALTRIPGTKDCGSIKLGARGSHVVTVCVKDDEGGVAAELRHSGDGGKHFDAPLRLVASDAVSIAVAVSPDGSALVSGACKTAVSGSCSGAPVVVKSERGRSSVTLAVTPPLSAGAMAPAFSHDGHSAYFLGRRAKDERLALFVSHDDGATFAERPLDPRSSRADRRPAEEGEEMGEEESEGELSVGDLDLTAIRPGEDGTVGLVLGTTRGYAYVTTDEDGRVRNVARAPIEQALIAGAGEHALAISLVPDRAPDDEGAVAAWESQDGGRNWSEIAVTRAVIREMVTGPMTLVCSGGGCLVGATISRVGWEGQAESGSARLLGNVPPRQERAMRTPLVCELDARARWTRIEHLDPIGLYGLPGADQAMRGRAFWSVVSYNRENGAVTATAALLPERGEGEARVSTQRLLGPAPGGARVATDVSHQMEGYAATRVRLPEGPKLTGQPMRDVEVAWENYLDGSSGRQRIADAGPFADRDVKPDNGRDLLDTGLVSVTPGAIFVRPHAPESRNALTFLLDAKGKRETFDYPVWPDKSFDRGIDVRPDAALVNGRPIAVGTLDDDVGVPVTLLLAQRTASGAWATTATSIAPGSTEDNERLTRIDWTYGAGAVGVVAMTSEPVRGRASATFQPFRADGTLGPPVALPTPFDLGAAAPRPCKAADRSATPRAEARLFARGDAMFPGTRHPVLVQEPPNPKSPGGEPMLLLTAGVVLHGTPDAPCVAAWEAVGAMRVPISAIIAGDPSRAWIFRRVLDVEAPPDPEKPKKGPAKPPVQRGPSLEYRPMSCKFDPGAKVPETAFAEPGTFRWVR